MALFRSAFTTWCLLSCCLFCKFGGPSFGPDFRLIFASLQRPAAKQTLKNCIMPFVFTVPEASAHCSRTSRKARILEHRRTEHRQKNAPKNEAREATNKSPKMTVLGSKTAPQINPGGLFFASSSALARQEADRRPKRQSGSRAPRSDFKRC